MRALSNGKKNSIKKFSSKLLLFSIFIIPNTQILINSLHDNNAAENSAVIFFNCLFVNESDKWKAYRLLGKNLMKKIYKFID